MLLEGEPPILIDEWQRFPESWDIVRRAVDKDFSPGKFILTGSALPETPPAHSGAGRIITLRMWTTTLAERYPNVSKISLKSLLAGDQFVEVKHCELTQQDYLDEIVVGGFPGWHNISGRARSLLLDSYIHRLVEHDFPLAGYQVRNPAALLRWLTAYAAATASTASYETIRDAATFGESDKPAKTTTIAYRDTLEAMWILEPQLAWLPVGSHLSRLKRKPKHHLADTALAAHLLSLSAESMQEQDFQLQDMSNSARPALVGSLFESMVVHDLRVYAQAADAKVFHMRTWNDEREVDAVIEHRGRLLAAEVKFGADIDSHDTRHLPWLRDRLGPKLVDTVVITSGQESYRDENGVAIIPAGVLGP